jgi:hypothetical protein
MRRIFIAMSLVGLTATTASAQGVKRPISDTEAWCRASRADKGYGDDNCKRFADFARSRYGSTATVAEWNSAVAAVGAKMRKGQ